MESDVRLWKRWQQERDSDALAAIVSRHSGLVYAASYRVLGNSADAEDVTQTCFLELIRTSLKIRSTLAPWLHTTAVRRSLDLLKANLRQQRRNCRVARNAESTENAVERLLLQIDEAIEDLPQELRDPIVLRFLEGGTHEAIGQTLGLAESTVRNRIAKGIDNLRAILARRGVEMTSAMLGATMASKLVEPAPSSLSAMLGKRSLMAKIQETNPSLQRVFRGDEIQKGTSLSTKAVALAATILTLGTVLALMSLGNEGTKTSERKVQLLQSPPILTENEGVLDAQVQAADLSPRERTDSVPRLESLPVSSSERISLRVVDQESRPIQNARIRTFEDSVPGEFLTDRDGECRIPVAPSSELLRLHVEASGFFHFSGYFESRKELSVRLYKTTTLHGRILEAETGEPIPRAELFLSHSYCSDCDGDRVVSDALGNFELPGVPIKRETTFFLRAEEFANQGFSFALDRESDRTEHDFLMNRGMLLWAAVVDFSTESPVGNVEYRDDGRTGMVVGTTDSSGEFEIRVLPSRSTGRIELRLRAPGYCRLRCSFNPSEVDPRVQERIRLPKCVSIEGRVRDPEGSAIVGAKTSACEDYQKTAERRRTGESSPLSLLPLQWQVSNEKQARQVWTDESGFFRLEGLVPWKDYEIDIAHGGYAVKQAEIHVKDADSWIDLDLAPLDRGGVIQGKLAVNGKARSGSYSWTGRTRSGMGQIPGSGQFRIDNVEPGNVRIQVWARESYGTVTGMPEQTVAFDVRADEEIDHDFRVVIPVSTISGRVFQSNGEPVRGKTVFALRSGDVSVRAHATSRTDGSYEIEVPNVGVPFSLSVAHGVESISVHDVDGGSENVDIVLPTLGQLRCRVLNRNTRKLVSDFDLFLRKPGDEEFRPFDQPLGPRGGFNLDLPFGTYDLMVRADRLGYKSLLVPEIVVVECPQTIDLDLEPGLVARLQLATDQASFPLSHTLLLLEAELADFVSRREQDGGKYWDGGEMFPFQTVLSRAVHFDPTGRAKVPGLSPGVFQLRVFPSNLSVEPSRIVLKQDLGDPVEIRWSAYRSK